MNTNAMNVAERVIATDIDCIVAMGGGRTLDVAKYAAFVSKKSFLSIPTTMAHDGIVSPIAVLKRQDSKPKSLGCAMPTMMIMDTKLIASCPPQLIKAGIGDTISNYMALKDWKFAVSRGKDSMNGYAYMPCRLVRNGHAVCSGIRAPLERNMQGGFQAVLQLVCKYVINTLFIGFFYEDVNVTGEAHPGSCVSEGNCAGDIIDVINQRKKHDDRVNYNMNIIGRELLKQKKGYEMPNLT